MNHVVLHALAIIAAILIPGAELVYFAWAVRGKCKDKQEEAIKGGDPIEEIRTAYRHMFPKESLRAGTRRERLAALQKRRRRKFRK